MALGCGTVWLALYCLALGDWVSTPTTLETLGVTSDVRYAPVYLRQGLPENLTPQEPALRNRPGVRWYVYRLLIERIGEEKYGEGVPVLREVLRGQLGTPLDRELDVAVVGSYGSYPECDRHRDGFVWELQYTALQSLAKIADPTALPEANAIYRASLAKVLAGDDEALWPSSSHLLGAALVARVACGDRTAVDDALNTFPSLPSRNGKAAVADAFSILASRYLYDPFDTGTIERGDVEKRLRGWWQEKREMYSYAYRRLPPFTWKEATPAPEPVTLEQHLDASCAAEVQAGFPWRESSERWLEEHVMEYMADLRRIVETEPDAGTWVRRLAAARLYAKHGGIPAFELLRQQALSAPAAKPGIPSSPYDPLMLIIEHFRDSAAEVAWACLERGSGCAARAASLEPVGQRPENLPRLASLFLRVSSDTGAQWEILSACLRAPECVDPGLFYTALASRDPSVIEMAVQGMDRYGLWEDRPPVAREAIDALERDPAYLVSRAAVTKDAAYLDRALALVPGDGPDSAIVHRRICELPTDLDGIPGFQERKGASNIAYWKCLNAYRKAHGRPAIERVTPQPTTHLHDVPTAQPTHTN